MRKWIAGWLGVLSLRLANAADRLCSTYSKRHAYTSTACVHQMHGKCRVTCKFCQAGCRCVCHNQMESSPVPDPKEQ